MVAINFDLRHNDNRIHITGEEIFEPKDNNNNNKI